MNTSAIYQRKAWNALSQDEAKVILQHLTDTQLPGFMITAFESFSKFNQHSFTAVLRYNNSEFVFVPGDTVTLGQDQWIMSGKNEENILAYFEGNREHANTYILEHLSPVRTVTIGPMVVERRMQETGYFPVAINDERLIADSYFAKAMDELRKSPNERYCYTVNGSYRLEKNGNNIKAFLYDAASYEELITAISDSGFRLPTEDEWEYLCGGGSRSMYPWGNEIDYQQKYHHFGVGKDGDYFLDTPNQFGLVIANNPYHYEVMMDSEWFLKGGDGGCTICGGGGLDMGYFSVATYYRDTNIFDEEMDFKAEITGDYTFTRRMKRLQ